jgi:N-acetylneuraminic acid mutarotase
MRTNVKLFALITLAFALSACGGGWGTPPAEISVTLDTITADVHVSESVQITATVHNSTNAQVTWNLSGAGCSGSTCGTIDIGGVSYTNVLYTAPASVPSPATVTLTASSVADASKSASATITILEAVHGWTWASGSNIVDQKGLYGKKAVADSSNVPGARIAAVSWIDSSGRRWLFGGMGYDAVGNDSSLNDLWRYDPTTLEWTWVSGSVTVNQAGIYGTQGIADPSNVPGARDFAVSWIDSSSKLWLFGGFGYDSVGNYSHLNDLWKYDMLEWTWVSGSNAVGQAGIYGTKGTADPSNVPGARGGAASWLDSQGKLWLFGGKGHDSAGYTGELNDLWMYDPTTFEWTWVSGSSSVDQTGIYGTQGTADPSNVPGGTYAAVSWLDSQGKLWLFGGYGYDSAGNYGILNNLWKYDPTILEWTWVSGSSSADQPGIYGTKGTADPSSVPGARYRAISWLDSQGKLWLFGGTGYDSAGNGGYLNDLWEYDPATLEWTWVSGSDTLGQAGTYGTKGTADPLNVPGAREMSVSWIDSGGKLWLFGGNGFDLAGNFGCLNDLWQYIR